MTSRHAAFVAFAIVMGFLMVLVTLIVVLAAANAPQDNDQTPIVTIRSCTKACEILV